ncbi:MAG: hypothetical protein JSR54_19805, partial [Proteobacteria bacterium]|nr:hypothetical protein [Pseudomonadota bacterium]
DPRHERAGYVRAVQVRRIALTPESAPELLAVVRYLRDAPGAEALGIGYAAAYLKVVPADALTPEPLDAIGTMAERLVRRVSLERPKAKDPALAAHVDGLAQYGLKVTRVERNGHREVCYEGEMFRRVLDMPGATPDQQARAALGLTRHECVAAGLGPSDRYQLDLWRASVLDRVPAGGVSADLLARVHARRAGVWSAVAFGRSRRGEPPQAAARRAMEELSAVGTADLGDAGVAEYADAAVRVGVVRWAAEFEARTPGKLEVATAPGAPGETCVSLEDTRHPIANPLLRRCTYGTVWTASARSNSAGTALTLAVQTDEAWRELWVFRKVGQGWALDVMSPLAAPPEVGYAEFAGWTPGGKRMLLAREARSDGRFRRRFEVVRIDTLVAEKSGSTPEAVPEFMRWQDSAWRYQTVALR